MKSLQIVSWIWWEKDWSRKGRGQAGSVESDSYPHTEVAIFPKKLWSCGNEKRNNLYEQSTN